MDGALETGVDDGKNPFSVTILGERMPGSGPSDPSAMLNLLPRFPQRPKCPWHVKSALGRESAFPNPQPCRIKSDFPHYSCIVLPNVSQSHTYVAWSITEQTSPRQKSLTRNSNNQVLL